MIMAKNRVWNLQLCLTSSPKHMINNIITTFSTTRTRKQNYHLEVMAPWSTLHKMRARTDIIDDWPIKPWDHQVSSLGINLHIPSKYDVLMNYSEWQNRKNINYRISDAGKETPRFKVPNCRFYQTHNNTNIFIKIYHQIEQMWYVYIKGTWFIWKKKKSKMLTVTSNSNAPIDSKSVGPKTLSSK